MLVLGLGSEWLQIDGSILVWFLEALVGRIGDLIHNTSESGFGNPQELCSRDTCFV